MDKATGPFELEHFEMDDLVAQFLTYEEGEGIIRYWDELAKAQTFSIRLLTTAADIRDFFTHLLYDGTLELLPDGETVYQSVFARKVDTFLARYQKAKENQKEDGGVFRGSIHTMLTVGGVRSFHAWLKGCIPFPDCVHDWDWFHDRAVSSAFLEQEQKANHKSEKERGKTK